MTLEAKTLLAEGRNLTTGIKPYTGPWEQPQRIHLLRRTLFGFTTNDLAAVQNLSLSETLDLLLSSTVEPAPPVNDYNNEELTDPNVDFGATWIHDDDRSNAELTSARVVSLKRWYLSQIMDQELSLHEKMTYFWHNHLATQAWEVFWPQRTYFHYHTLRGLAFGNFKKMVRAITLDPHMLLYLNGAANNKFAPDENYSRELQELFCIGKGPEAQFTESDVQEAARILTGHSIDWEGGGHYLWRPYWHDEGDKQFSSFYGDTVISGRSGDAGRNEVDDLIDMIFSNNEVAAFIVRKMYRFFIHTVIDDQAEAEVIQPLANKFRDDNYEIAPVMRTLLESEHFFDQGNYGASIKSPLDFLIGFWRSFGVEIAPQATHENIRHIKNSLHWSMSNIGQEIMDPPNVAGYPAYYQIPQYDKHWITTNTITNRAVQTDSFVFWGFWSQSLLTNVDLIAYLKRLKHPDDPVKLIDEISELHLGIPLGAEVKARMLAILLSGQQTNSYWTNAWYDHLDDPTNAMKKEIVSSRLKVMFQFFFQRSEFQLH